MPHCHLANPYTAQVALHGSQTLKGHQPSLIKDLLGRERVTGAKIAWSILQDKRKTEFQGGGALPIMAYTGRLRPKGVPFSGFKYIKG